MRKISLSLSRPSTAAEKAARARSRTNVIRHSKIHIVCKLNRLCVPPTRQLTRYYFVLRK
jgi:hypothetical protein